MQRIPVPGRTTRMSDRWPQHIARGSAGGTDMVDGYGTPVKACLAGRVTIVDNSPDGSGGRYFRVTGWDGDSIECLHNSSILASRGMTCDPHTQVAISGASAFGSNYGTGGPHIHIHGVRANGVRFDVEPWFDFGNSAPASGGNATPITETDDTEMLSAEAQAFVTTTVRNEVNSLLNEDKPGRPSVRATIVQQVNQSLNTITKAITQDIINAITRERWQLARVKGRDTLWAINMTTGAFEQFGNMAQLQKAQQHELISTYVVNGVRVPEPAMEFDSVDELNAFIDGLKVDPDERAV